MVEVEYSEKIRSIIQKLKNRDDVEKLKKQIKKIIENPEIGKPMRYSRKDTREVYVGSFRLSYFYSKEENKLFFLNLYHKDEQ